MSGVDLGGCPPRPPTDPDVQNSRIRLLRRMDSLRNGRSSGRPSLAEEAIEFIEILRKARDRDGLRIYAWTLMSNHYHLAVRAGPVPLSRTMGYVQARFGQGYNRRHGSSGPRWQSRYKARLVGTSRVLRPSRRLHPPEPGYCRSGRRPGSTMCSLAIASCSARWATR